MNKLNIVNHIISKQLDHNIIFEEKKEYIPKYLFTFCKDTTLEITLQELDSKLEMQFILEKNVHVHLVIKKQGLKTKMLCAYQLDENSHLEVVEYQDMDAINQKNMISLNGKEATIDYIVKTISIGPEKYDFLISHNASKTCSSIINHGVNMKKGTLSFTVTTDIPKGNIGCVANQNNRIINLNEKECIIRPNLLIEEYDVMANHSAYIGSFKEEELFYLQKAGIPYEEARKLLIEGFMKSKVDPDMITEIYTKYWR